MDDSSLTPPSLSEQAINLSLDSQWEKALKINKKILKSDPQNVDALNREAKAYMELGKINLTKKYYSLVLKIDPYNPIALKNLKIIKSFKPNGQNPLQNSQNKFSPSLFLQEPGKTKMVSLLKVAEPQKLSQAFCGMKVAMVVKNRKITIIDGSANYLGVLPDDISHHLQRLIKGGNKYEFFIKSIRVNGLSVLIRETFRSKRFKNQPSFLENSDTILTGDLLTSVAQNEADEEVNEEEADQEV